MVVELSVDPIPIKPLWRSFTWDKIVMILLLVVGARDGRTQSARACLFSFPSLQTHPP